MGISLHFEKIKLIFSFTLNTPMKKGIFYARSIKTPQTHIPHPLCGGVDMFISPGNLLGLRFWSESKKNERRGETARVGKGVEKKRNRRS